MDDQLLTLSKIFTEKIFRIPDYQRGYAWSKKQLQDFWNDIQQIELGCNHYTGVLTVENVPEEVYKKWENDLWIIEAKKYTPLYIVDGQQRITTAIILIQVILEKTPNDQDLNFTEKKDVQKKFIFESKDKGISRSYIFGYEKDNPSYEFLKTKIFLEESSSSDEGNNETIYTQNLQYAKKFFKEQISSMTQDEIQSLHKKVTQQLLFNTFTINEDVDVCVAFETMNNRGKPLSYLELLKNRLIYLSIKIRVDDSEKKTLRNTINDCWKSIYCYLGLNKNKPLSDDLFLNNHYLSYFGGDIIDSKNNKLSEDSVGFNFQHLLERPFLRIDSDFFARNLLEEKFIQKNINPICSEKSKVNIDFIYDYVRSLQESVRIWYAIFNPSQSNYSDQIKLWLDKLNRLDTASKFYPLLLVVFQKEKEESSLVELLKALEKLCFVTKLVDGFFMHRAFPLLDVVKNTHEIRNQKTTTEKYTKYLSDETLNLIRAPHVLEVINEKFKTDGFYSWSGIKYFLYEYDLSLKEKTKMSQCKIDWTAFNLDKADYTSVEHIYPQNPKGEYWKKNFSSLSNEQRKQLKNSLGNLLPLSKEKNSSLSNRPFPEKIVGKQERGKIGYRYGCYAENEITQYNDWTPETILERGLQLLSFMEDRWGLSLGSEEKKIEMLGLSFLISETKST